MNKIVFLHLEGIQGSTPKLFKSGTYPESSTVHEVMSDLLDGTGISPSQISLMHGEASGVNSVKKTQLLSSFGGENILFRGTPQLTVHTFESV